LILAGQATAQTFTTLYSFTETSDNTNSDGDIPRGALIVSGSTLYGTAMVGGSSGQGTVFAINSDGTGFTTLHSFTGAALAPGSDGARPTAGLLLSGGTLYGTTIYGGSSGYGTVFAINTNGTGFTTLHSFSAPSPTDVNSDGTLPQGELILSGNTLYGTAANAGDYGHGTVFSVATNGTGFSILHAFTGSGDGADPVCKLVLSGNTLYGTAHEGGNSGYGTVFAVNTDGSGFTTVYSFTGGSDGSVPWGGLVLSGDTLYGTAGANNAGDGVVFAVNTNGTDFTILYSFTGGSDGVELEAPLILSGDTLYGTTDSGGNSGHGTVFSVETNGSGFTTLYSFTGGSGGGGIAGVWGGLVLSGNTLYGTASGGSAGDGMLFSLSLPISGPQFSLSLTPGSVTVDEGGDATYDLTIGSLDGFSGDVTLSVSGLPSGATASFSASSLSTPGTATLTITTASTDAPGTYTLTITGTSGSLVEQATATLVVAAPNFSMSASPSSQSVTVGSSTTYEATVTSSGGFDGAVSFSASGLPSGATASFSPASVSGSGSSTLTVTTKSTMRTGSTSLTITGRGPNGSPVHSTTATLTITK
jgi:uncharacterized repeat protein (TIGR03803 family)